MHGASVPELTCLIPCDHHRTRGSAACWHARPREGARPKGKLMFVQEKRSGARSSALSSPRSSRPAPLFRSEPPRLGEGVTRKEPLVCLAMKPAAEGPTPGTNGLRLRPSRAERVQIYGRCVVIKFPKDKKVKPTDQSEVHQPVVGEAGPREADPKALVQPFAPMVEPRSIADLKVNPRNARTHSDRQVEQIAASVLKFGCIIPIVVNEKGVVLAGHGRLRAAHVPWPRGSADHRGQAPDRGTPARLHAGRQPPGRAGRLGRGSSQGRAAGAVGPRHRLRIRGHGLRHGRPRPPGGTESWPKRRSRRWCRSWRATARQSAPPATCGSSASIFCCAAALWSKPPTRR